MSNTSLSPRLFCAVFLLGISFSPKIALATELSKAELAAKNERQLTPTERSIRQTGCAFSPVRLGSIRVTEDLKAEMVRLPEIHFIQLVSIVYEGHSKGTFAITSYESLPNGGIGGKDFCEPSQIETFQPPQERGDIIKVMALRLRDGLDLVSEYPNTSKEILRRNQLITISSGTYALFDKSQTSFEEWLAADGQEWARSSAPSPLGFSIGDRFAIRISK